MHLMLFSGDDGKKRLGSLSGGEAARLVFSRLALEKPNVLILDEPTNHLDLESIEALVAELGRYEGTLILVSHDRWFVSQLATRVVEIRPDGMSDFLGTYEEYVHYSGDDHLDADRVILKARREKRARKKEARQAEPEPEERPEQARRRLKKLERERDELTESLETLEGRMGEIDTAFCEPGFFEATDADEVARLEAERSDISERVDRVVARWESLEAEIDALSARLEA